MSNTADDAVQTHKMKVRKRRTYRLSPNVHACLRGRCPKSHPLDDILDGAAELFYTEDSIDVPTGIQGFRTDARAIRGDWIIVASYLGKATKQTVSHSMDRPSVGQLVFPHMTEEQSVDF